LRVSMRCQPVRQRSEAPEEFEDFPNPSEF
jgi:hypothetical protein